MPLQSSITRSVCALTIVALLGGCGSGDATGPPQSSSASAAPTSSATPTNDAPLAPRESGIAPQRSSFLPCLEEGDAFSVVGASRIPVTLRETSVKPFVVGFKNSTFGKQVGDVIFAPFRGRAMTRNALRAVKPELDPRRRIFVRDGMLVIFGTRANKKASTLVISCLDKGLKR